MDRAPFDLAPFLAAQDAAWPEVTAELRAGRKTSHWIWFVFPQLRALGHSDTARFFGLVSLDEARAYLDHPTLRARLAEACDLLLAAPGSDLVTILGDMGSIDALKVRSSMTLFLRADPSESRFRAVLDRFHGGHPDPETDRLLG